MTAADLAMVERFVSFSLQPDSASAPELGLAPEGVRLGLGDRLLVDLPVTSVADPAAWEIPEEVFRARSGPFSALDVLGSRAAGVDGDPSVSDGRDLVVTVGEHPHCASPPVPEPPEMRTMRRVSAQPAEDAMSSCLDWFAVDFFVDSNDSVVAITLDLWEP